MAFPVQHLLAHKPTPVYVPPAEPADGACRLMREHGFSQLPVVSDKGIALGMVTHESILRALGHFNVPLERLRVSAALISPRSLFPDDDFFELLETLADEYATLIVDKDSRLVGIITQDDLLDYFRRRSEDLILVEEIELGLREHVLCAFSDPSGLLRTELCAAVDEVADQAGRFRRKFLRALQIYLGGTNKSGQKPSVDEAEADKAFKTFELKYRAKELTDLTFDETRALLFHDQRWGTYGSAFGIDKKALSDLLERIRDTRNKLAHFRGDIGDDERERLRFCSQFLDNHRPSGTVPTIASIREVQKPTISEPAPKAVDVPTSPLSAPTPRTADKAAEVKNTAIEDEQGFEGDRYAPLVADLARATTESVSYRFEEIERVLDRKLPSTARRHRAWWANDRSSHVQSRLWLEAGWRVSSISITAETVTFSKILERPTAYSEFFSRLLRATHRGGTPAGTNWQEMERVGEGRYSVPILGSFARGGKFRIELLIDLALESEDRRREKNKRVFDALAKQRDEIEQRLGHPLDWERLDHRVVSRIALYRVGSVLDNEEALNHIIKWVTVQLPIFGKAIAPDATRILARISHDG